MHFPAVSLTPPDRDPHHRYPIAYIIVILPISVARFLSFYDHEVAFPWTVFAGVLLGLSGIINVILYSLTRPSLRPPARSAREDWLVRRSVLASSHARDDSGGAASRDDPSAPIYIGYHRAARSSISRECDEIGLPLDYQTEEFSMSRSFHDTRQLRPFLLMS